VSHFEFVFSLFGLLLGLSLAEVLGGAARTLKVRRRVRVGWLTPLLGLFVMLNLVSFWMGAWNAQALIPVAYPVLLIGLAITGLYYMGASLVFPADAEKWPDLDAYYFEHRRQVLLVFALSWWMRGIAPTPIALAVDGVPSLLVLAAMISANRLVGIVSLSGLTALYLLLWIFI
jgi:hypothetical protein